MCLKTIACRPTFSAAVCQALLLLLAALAAAEGSSLLPAVVDSPLPAESVLGNLCQNSKDGDEEKEAGLCAVGIACWVASSGKACVSTEKALLKPESESVLWVGSSAHKDCF